LVRGPDSRTDAGIDAPLALGENRGVTASDRFVAALDSRQLVLTEGALVERLRRDPRIQLDPHVANASLLYSEAGASALSELWRGYLDVARGCDRAMIVCTPTWRANPERLARARLPPVQRVSADAAALLLLVRARCGAFAERVFVGGLIGCRGDAYLPREALDEESAERFHAPQAEALASAGVDVLLAATLPAFTEAAGMARALAATGRPYLVSFVLRPAGTLLDGTPLAEAIARIDDAVAPAPTGYLAGCTHPATFRRAMEVARSARRSVQDRVIGVQGNASRKSPEELEGSAQLEGDDPETFAEEMRVARERFRTRILGGCCGTDERHIAAVARNCV
jgi:homocysteine S-methyltransferase